MKLRDFTVKGSIESYGWYWIGYDGNESKRPCPMTEKQARYLAKVFSGYVVPVDPSSLAY